MSSAPPPATPTEEPMNTRREFVQDAAGAAAGIAFVGCGLLGTAPAQAQARRREVVVNGRRVKVVDVHAHCAVPEAMALMGLKIGAPGSSLPPLLHVAQNAADPLASRLKGNGLLANVIGNPLETTIALSHLIFEGTLDRFPGLKICAAHGGGYLPSYAGRSDQGCLTFPDRCPGPKDGPLKKKPTEYLRQLYYDNILFTPEAMRHLAAEVGPSQLVVGTG